MSIDVSINTAQKKSLADLLRAIAKLVEGSRNKRVTLNLDLDFVKTKKKKEA